MWGRTGLIGDTGFVGGTLVRDIPVSRTYNSRSIERIAGEHFDTLVCANGADLDRLDVSRGSPHAIARARPLRSGHLQVLVCNQNALGRLLRATKDVIVPGLARLRRRFSAEEREP